LTEQASEIGNCLLETVKEYCLNPDNYSCANKNTSAGINITLYVFFVFGVLLTTCGNLVVIISISHFKQLHTQTNLLVLSLAVTDFLLGLFVMPISMIKTVDKCWSFSSALCITHKFLDLVLSTGSVIHLLFIAVDRYYAVSYPLLYSFKITFSVALMFVIVSWLWPIFYISISLFYFKGNHLLQQIDTYSCEEQCISIAEASPLLFDLLISFFLPFSIMSFLYTKICFVARRHAKAIKCASKQNKERLAQIKENKASKTLGIVITVFVLCWLPYSVYCILNILLTMDNSEVTLTAFEWLAYFNSGINPIIYGLFYPWFRKTFKIIISCRIFKPDSSLISVFPDK
uniref:G-protein coupled receptors family 1 profile domain-containing protein n=1 Tax=Erpetoichthys calabaricus TaxID=27687 RepID=A0A8C4RFQ7_ERPCA